MESDIVKRLIVASYSEANELEDLLLEAANEIQALRQEKAEDMGERVYGVKKVESW